MWRLSKRARRLAAIVVGLGAGAAAAIIALSSGDQPIVLTTPSCSALSRLLAKAAPAAGVPRVGSSLTLGVSANLRSDSGDYRCGLATEVKATGVRLIREDISWAKLQPSRGSIDWATFDNLVLYAAEQGFQVLPVLIDTPSWAGSGLDAVPRDIQACAAFAVAAARRYGPGGELWRAHPDRAARPVTELELMNEPYLQGQDPRRYAGLASGVAAAMRRDAPRVGVLVVGAPGSWLGGVLNTAPELFTQGLVAGITLHPYSLRPPGAPPGPDTTRRVESAHDQLTAIGAGSTPLWITEVGWSTCPAGQDAGCVKGEGAQAEDLRETLRLATTKWAAYVRGLLVYDIRDAPPRSDGDKERYFGLLRVDGTPKPAWSVLDAAAPH